MFGIWPSTWFFSAISRSSADRVVRSHRGTRCFRSTMGISFGRFRFALPFILRYQKRETRKEKIENRGREKTLLLAPSRPALPSFLVLFSPVVQALSEREEK